MATYNEKGELANVLVNVLLDVIEDLGFSCNEPITWISSLAIRVKHLLVVIAHCVHVCGDLGMARGASHHWSWP
jgi:hypothetical protein